jgi:hypothetical protein
MSAMSVVSVMRIREKAVVTERARRSLLRKAYRQRMRELRRTHPVEWRAAP